MRVGPEVAEQLAGVGGVDHDEVAAGDGQLVAPVAEAALHARLHRELPHQPGSCPYLDIFAHYCIPDAGQCEGM